MDIKNFDSIETYINNFKYYFLLCTDVTIEGEIVLGSGEHGGETYLYVSHVEYSSDNVLNNEETEVLETYLQDNINELVFNAESI